jgi:hypothetical protein
MRRDIAIVMTVVAGRVNAHDAAGALVAVAYEQSLWWWASSATGAPVRLCRRTVNDGEVRNALARHLFGRK